MIFADNLAMMYTIAILLAVALQDQPSKQLQEQGFEIVELQPSQQQQQQQSSRHKAASHYNGKPKELKPAKMKHKGVPKFKKPKAFRK